MRSGHKHRSIREQQSGEGQAPCAELKGQAQDPSSGHASGNGVPAGGGHGNEDEQTAGAEQGGLATQAQPGDPGKKRRKCDNCAIRRMVEPAPDGNGKLWCRECRDKHMSQRN